MINKLKYLIFPVATVLFLIIVVSGMQMNAQGINDPLQLIEVRKIWDRAPYNAFTDLVRYNDR